MTQRFPLAFQCDECDILVREWLNARHTDQEGLRNRVLEAARSSGRDPEEMRAVWVFSVARMPDDEMRTVMRAHSPRATEARRKWLEHEAATGHPVAALGSAVLMGYRRPPPAHSR